MNQFRLDMGRHENPVAAAISLWQHRIVADAAAPCCRSPMSAGQIKWVWLAGCRLPAPGVDEQAHFWFDDIGEQDIQDSECLAIAFQMWMSS